MRSLDRLSVVVPVHNEASNLPRLHAELSRVVPSVAPTYEIIFVDDGSTDGSDAAIRRLQWRDASVRRLTLSRNFGKEIALTAGIQHARGDAAVLIDADLQHPVDLIPVFVRHYRQGADMVVGVRASNQGEGWFKRWGSVLYYRLITLLSDSRVVARSTDFRLLSRQVIDAFNRFHERNRMTRSLLDWLGFPTHYVPFHAPARAGGVAAYGPGKLLRLALSSFVAHSLFPLRFAGYLGVVIIAVTAPLGVFVYVTKFLMDNPFSFSGPAVLAVINVFLAGVMLTCLGLIALYVANIHDQSMARPLYVLRDTDDQAPVLSVASVPVPLEPVGAVARPSVGLSFARHHPPAAY